MDKQPWATPWSRAPAICIQVARSASRLRAKFTMPFHQLDEARQALAAATASFDLAQKTLTSEQRKYELGAETNFFVLDAQTRLAQAELILLQTQVNYRIALAAVGHSTGDLLSPYHVQITQLSR